MDFDTCLQALKLLNEEAGKQKLKIEIAVYGGAAMLLRFDKSEITNDIDVSVKGITPNELLSLSLGVADALGLEPGWINAAISVFTSKNETSNDFDFLDIGDNLSVYLASPQYLLAMKIISMRTDQDSHDIKDINILLDELGLNTAEDALKIVYKYYPKDKVRQKSIIGLKEIFMKRDSDLAKCGTENSK